MGDAEAAMLRTAAPLFADLSDDVLEHVWQAGTTLPPLVAGEPLPQGEGDEATFTVVLRGVLEHSSTGVRLPAGQATGVANLLLAGDTTQPAWVAAGPDGATVWQITADAFARLRAGHRELERALFRHVASRVRAAGVDDLDGAVLQAPPLPARPREARPIVRIFDNQSYQFAFFQEVNQNPEYQYQLDPVDVRLSEHTVDLARGAFAVCIFVSDQVNAAVVRRLKEAGVGLISLRCAGFDGVDVKHGLGWQVCNELGISVVRVPAYSPYAVAEHAVGMMMCLNRKLHLAYNKIRVGDFTLNSLVGMDVHGKTVGVIGTGKIGQCFIDIMVGFGCRILCYDAYPNDAVAKKPNTTYTDLATLLRESDILSLHVPLTEETRYLINDATLAQTKPGVIVINTSRGGLIDSKALVRALKSGRLGGCALDVYEDEGDYFYRNLQGQNIKDDLLARLTTFQNVLITSHQGFLTREALQSIAATTLSNIREYENGKRLHELTNSVNKLA